jgi:hypothetical protein
VIGKKIGKIQQFRQSHFPLNRWFCVHMYVNNIGKRSAKMLTKAAIEPAIPTQRLRALEDLACTIVERIARLSSKLQEPLRVQVDTHSPSRVQALKRS